MDFVMTDYCGKLSFPREATGILTEVWTEISASGSPAGSMLASATELLFDGKGREFLKPLSEIGKLYPHIPQETIDMAFLLSCLPELEDRYRKAGLSERIFRESMDDLRCKLWDCKKGYGIWGTTETHWFDGFFRLTRFAFGRLQFEYRQFPVDSFDQVQKGETVCACHIPSSGPLTEESVTDSLQRAADFFKDVRIHRRFPVVCHSWLLYPPLVNLFPRTSNISKFAARFELFNIEHDPENKDARIIFHTRYDPKRIAELPEDTSLQKAIRQHLLNGNCMGTGYGILWVDPLS